MIDLHCHILPNVDDGSKSLEESIEMAKIAVNDGIKTIVNTSHYNPSFEFEMGKILEERVKAFNEELKARNIDLDVLIGNELYYTKDIISDFESLDFYSINKSKYILIEFPVMNFPKNLTDIIYEIKLKNYIPILAHVERYSEVIENPNLIYSAIKEGALIQINASSIIGKNGKEIEKTCEILLNNDMVHFVCTDAHGSSSRRPLMRDAYDYVSKKYSVDLSDKLFNDNAKIIIDNKNIDIKVPIMYTRKKGFFSKFIKR